ncbi:MAG TPA: DUF1631 family protein [Nevskiaceae bacterium]|nr:DUF1631 family protein [Nevskiaceae bacterium]
MLRSKVTRIAPYIGAIPQFLAAAPTPALAETHPVIDELADVAKDALNQQIRGALAGASRYFTARAEKTEDERLRRDFLDALHALRLSVASVQRACAVELDRVMTQAPADAKSEPAPITALCQSLWDGLREQLDALCVKFQVTPFAPRLSPENLRAAIRHGVGRADLSQRTIALTQDLVEHGVLAHLDQVYRRVAERLEQYSLPGVATQFPVAVNQPAMPAPATSLHVDPHTKALLVEVAQTREPDAARKSSYGNAELATELLESLKTERSHGAVPVRSRAVAQRLALVGRMFGVIGADVRLPDAFRRAFEKLRFPIIKSALADSNFFTQKSHSLRMITADLVQRAIAHADSTHQLQALIGSAAGNFDLSATFVRPVLAGLRPLQAAAIEQFLADLQDASTELTRLIDERERNRVRAEGLREQLADLQHAEIAAPAVEIVSYERPAERKVEGERKVEAAPVVHEPDPHILETLFLSAVWFRVYDHKQRKPRWLRLESFYPERDAVAFAEFDGANPLAMKATQFLDDLKSGRSAPTNPDDRVRRLLARLQKEQTAA